MYFTRFLLLFIIRTTNVSILVPNAQIGTTFLHATSVTVSFLLVNIASNASDKKKNFFQGYKQLQINFYGESNLSNVNCDIQLSFASTVSLRSSGILFTKVCTYTSIVVKSNWFRSSSTTFSCVISFFFNFVVFNFLKRFFLEFIKQFG